MEDMIYKAMNMASAAHQHQTRKYHDWAGVVEPYIMHPARVVGSIIAHKSSFRPCMLPHVIAAGWLHDVIEDCHIQEVDIQEHISDEAAALVVELTNPSKSFPGLSREEKKSMDRTHLSTVSKEAKIMKMFDRIDNLRSVQNAPSKWVAKYITESKLLHQVVKDGDVYIGDMFLKIIKKIGRE